MLSGKANKLDDESDLEDANSEQLEEDDKVNTLKQTVNYSSPNSRRGTLRRTGTVVEQDEEYLSSGSSKRKKSTMNNTRVLKELQSNKKIERDRVDK